MLPALLIQVTQLLVFTAFILASIVAATSWAVRTRRLTPFGAWPRLVRRIARPATAPMERRLLRSGGNPQDAAYWLLGIAVIGGLVLLSLFHWLLDTIHTVVFSLQAGPRGLLRLIAEGGFSLLMIALWVRVIASWFGISPYRRWMRPVMALTGWMVDPIRRILPPFGMIDFSPLVTMILLWLASGLVMSWL